MLQERRTIHETLESIKKKVDDQNSIEHLSMPQVLKNILINKILKKTSLKTKN